MARVRDCTWPTIGEQRRLLSASVELGCEDDAEGLDTDCGLVDDCDEVGSEELRVTCTQFLNNKIL